MKIIRPALIDDAVLNSSNVPESETVWSSGTTYAFGAIVRGSGAAAHRIYESQQSGNLGHDPAPDNGTWWLEAGATNRWRMFDGSVTSQTTNANSVEVELQAAGRINSVALLNLDAASATVSMMDATDGEVFNQTYSLVSPSGVIDWYAYFFEPIERLVDLLVTDMPPYADAAITVTIDDPGGTAKIGALVMGLSKDIGLAQYGATVGIQDFSRKEIDPFGNYSITKRAFAKRASFTVWSENGLVDQIQRLLAEYRAEPIVYVGSEEFGSTIVFGFYREFSIEIAYPTHSICTLSLEGLT